MKKFISFVLVAAMLFCMLPLAAMADSVSYTDLDYSQKLEFGEILTTFESDDEYVETSLYKIYGYTKAYSVEMTAGKYYNIGFSLDISTSAEGVAGFALLNDLTGTYDDVVYKDYSYIYTFYHNVSRDTVVECEETGTYYLLVTGDIKKGSTQLFGDDIELYIYIYEYDSYTTLDYSENLPLSTDTTVSFGGDVSKIYYEMSDDFYGYGKGFNVDLNENTYYTLTLNTDDEYSFEGNFMLMSKYISGNAYEDALNILYIADNVIYFYVDKTDTYTFLISGYVYDFGFSLITEAVDITLNLSETTFTTVEIDSAEQLMMFGDDLYNDLFPGDAVKAVITQDIDMSEEEWVSIYCEYEVVVVEGNGHTITGLHDALFDELYEIIIGIYDLTVDIQYNLDSPMEDVNNMSALVKYIYGNMVLNNVHTTGSMNINAYYIEDVGSFVGQFEGIAYFDECTSNINFDLTSEYTASCVGGIAGYFHSNFNHSTIENSSWNGDMKITSIYDSNYSFGGFIGDSQYGFTFRNCSATGSITINTSEDMYTFYVGGFVGNACENIYDNCFANVDIVCETGIHIGGFIGSNEPNVIIKNCYSSGSVKGIENVGGFVGESYAELLILNCYTTSDVVGENCVGGFVGNIYYISEFVNCYATGSVESTMVDDPETPDNELEWLAIGSFFGYCEDMSEVSFDNCFAFASDLPVGTTMDLDTDTYIPYDGDGITEVDFSLDVIVSALEAALNKKVEELRESGFEGLCNWGDRNDENGPMLVEAPDLPTFILGDVDNDGDVDADDYIILKRVYFGVTLLENLDTPETALLRSDVYNFDSLITADDYITLKRVYFGMATLG